MNTLIDLKAELMFAESAIRVLDLDTNTKHYMYEQIAKRFGLSKQETKPQELSTLLKDTGVSAQSFKRRALKAGYIKIQPWPHKTKPGKFRNRTILTDKGKTYGVNTGTDAQPLWFAHTFQELLTLI